jgi:CubicO group peptidase (beta-lactamase class C family)
VRRRDFLYLAGLVAVPPACAATAQRPDPLAALESAIVQRMTEYDVPGVAFGLFKDGRIHARGFGITNVDNPQPVTEDTVFPIASISKTVAATAAMRLAQDGRLDMAAPVRSYLPDFSVQDESTSRELRIWHLLTHTPGFEGQLAADNRGAETLAQFIVRLRDVPSFAAPGEIWGYNNAGFTVLGRVIEVITGTTVHEAFRDLVFAPLGLSHAFTETGTAMTHRFAAGHRRGQTGRAEVIRPFELPASVTAGGAAMSVSSLLAYAAFHLGDGTAADRRRILPQAALEDMRTPRLRKNATDDEIGVAWHLRTLNGVQTAVHGGTLGGHCLHLQLVPERRLAFAILTNHSEGWRLIQDVERATLETCEGLSLAPNQATGGNRGVNETMTAHATPLAQQPDPGDYIGRYARVPLGTTDVRVDKGALVVSGFGFPPGDTSLVFYGRDLAYTTTGAYTGMPVEFVRRGSGTVEWVRINGRVGRRA